MNELYIVQVGADGGATRAFIFKLSGSETTIQMAQKLADEMAEPLIIVYPAVDFVGRDFYELCCI